MTEKVYVVTDLGPGDGGKGGVVHKISHMMGAHTIVKVGGGQGSHGVCTFDGERFAFSHWGCGTFEGVRSHLTSRMVISPVGILNEFAALRYQCGIADAFDLLTIDRDALCATPYHGIASRLREVARGNNPRGTVGTGIGEAYRYSQRVPQYAIHARDLMLPNLRDLVEAGREQIRADLAVIIGGEFLSSDHETVKQEIALLNDDEFLDRVIEQSQEVSRRVTIVDQDYLQREILSQGGVVVVESSHGILTDCFYGFHPHTSAIRTLPRFTKAMLAEAGYSGEVVNIGVTRAYQIRHGAGPLPTADPAMVGYLLPGSSKDENRYQGKVRVGPLDLVLLRYALDVCGGPASFDGLAVTWFDQIQASGIWRVCDRYHHADEVAPIDAIVVRHGEDAAHLEYQEAIGRQLLACQPEVTTYHVRADATRDELYSLCANVLQSRLGVPVRMVSFGPTEQDKLCR